VELSTQHSGSQGTALFNYISDVTKARISEKQIRWQNASAPENNQHRVNGMSFRYRFWETLENPG
jgi:hypothetical protein